MKRFVVAMVCCLSVSVGAQEPTTQLDNSAMFDRLAGQTKIGFLGDRSVIENMMRSAHLSKIEGGELMGTFWGHWRGENQSGRLDAYAALPELLNPKNSYFWVSFDAPSEQQIPPAMLSHLLAKAQATNISGGDTIDIELPFVTQLGGCVTNYKLTARITGALVSTTVFSRCPIREMKKP